MLLTINNTTPKVFYIEQNCACVKLNVFNKLNSTESSNI